MDEMAMANRDQDGVVAERWSQMTAMKRVVRRISRSIGAAMVAWRYPSRSAYVR